MSNIHQDRAWDLIESYFRDHHLERLVRHQIDSYNYFTNIQLEQTINMFNPIIIHSENDYNVDLKLYSLELVMNMRNMRLHRPQIHENNGATTIMLPHDARVRNFTYSSAITVDLDITILVRGGDTLTDEKTIKTQINNVHIGKLPIMLKSSICCLKSIQDISLRNTHECKYDAGGYFIINGSEKTVLGQERVAENTVYCFPVKQTTKWSWTSEIKSVPDSKQISPKQINIMISSKPNEFGHVIHVQLARMKTSIPLFTLFRVLGVISDKAITNIIVNDLNSEQNQNIIKNLRASVIESKDVLTRDAALEYVISNCIFNPHYMTNDDGNKKKYAFVNDMMDVDLFPHCNTRKQKIYFLGYMTLKLVETFLGLRECDDRDSFQNKRVDTVGVLLNNLFRNYVNKLVKDIQKASIREINTGSWRSSEDYANIINTTNIYKIVKGATIENGIKRALATGDFGIKQINQNKVGVAQVLNRMTYVSTLSHLRRINTPIDKSGKLIPPRKLHSTTFGYLCPAETPEGPSVGIVKNLSYMTLVTVNSFSNSLYDYVNDYVTLVDDLDIDNNNEDLFRFAKVLINGCFMGLCDDGISLYHNLKRKKRQGIINVYTSICFDYKRQELIICNDAGRLVRPLLVVKNKKHNITTNVLDDLTKGNITWGDLLISNNCAGSIIEYIDPREQNNTMISMFWKDIHEHSHFMYEYCEIHPSTIFGVLGSCIPFPEHNQSPRNTYQCAMGKQAMGVYVTNHQDRLDKTAYVLTYPTRPLVDTRVMSILQLHKIPSGSMVIVAIMTHTGYNQEDSILFNEAAIQRGLFQATVYHTEKDEDRKIYGDEEIRGIPDKTKTKGVKFGNYSKINRHGVMDTNTLITNQDIIIGKYVPIKENKNDNTKRIKYEDHSRGYKTTEECYVDRNYLNRNGDGYKFCKVKIRTLRQPTIGDKFSSRHGQKGTIGNVIPERDMPFSSNGVKPDIIINPHAIPSRMTIAQLKETLLGKALLELGLFGDGTSFGELNIKDICNQLSSLGYESKGNEILYNGMTGEQIDTEIFMGPCFYQRLKHMVADKQHSRSIGPMVSLTRQPAEGRSRDGGLRCGEMERDGLICHGMAQMTKDRLFNCSDKYHIYACNSCGMQASVNVNKKIYICMMCDNRTSFSKLNVPYAYKLLTQELVTMNIAPRYVTK